MLIKPETIAKLSFGNMKIRMMSILCNTSLKSRRTSQGCFSKSQARQKVRVTYFCKWNNKINQLLSVLVDHPLRSSERGWRKGVQFSMSIIGRVEILIYDVVLFRNSFKLTIVLWMDEYLAEKAVFICFRLILWNKCLCVLGFFFKSMQ